jgi:dUTP pyrophosphatase
MYRKHLKSSHVGYIMTTFTHLLFNRTDKFMLLKIFVEDNELRHLYTNLINTHNNRVLNTYFYDAGFDLVTPTDYSCAEGLVTKINFQVKCAAQIVCDTGRQYPIGFHLYPRSSLSNMPLRLANSVGIIDSGYRGDLIGAFDCNTSGSQYLVLKHDKLVQICAPGLVPIIVELVDTPEQLGETSRGEGGFGSTGR